MRLKAAGAALTFFLLGSVGILTADWLLTRSDGLLTGAGATVKGILFVALGSLLLYVMVVRSVREKQATLEDRERLERRLSAVARFEAIGQLTAGIAHDFNNLITAISGNIAAYTATLPGEEVPQELREANRSAERAALLTRQLLAYGRRQVLRPVRVDVNETIEGMSALLHRLIGDRIELRLELEPELEAVHVDPGHLEQVVMNLAINARDAMTGGGELRIRTANQQVNEAAARRFTFPFRPGDYVRIDVVDTGVGIRPEIQARIFEPFFTTKPKDVGTGLGLSTAYGIVKQSGGHIALRSKPGKGTVFSVYLPWSTEPAGPQPDAAPPDSPEEETTGTETVLVAEDDSAVRTLVIRILQQRGFAVLEAQDGQEALDVLRAVGRIDLLITDAVMPAVSGTQLIEAARSVLPKLRVLLVSGYTDAHFDPDWPYLSKPFTPNQLLRRVREVLDA